VKGEDNRTITNDPFYGDRLEHVKILYQRCNNFSPLNTKGVICNGVMGILDTIVRLTKGNASINTS
jgi:hypothetical protein